MDIPQENTTDILIDNPQLIKGAFIEERYVKCYKQCECKWRLDSNHKGYKYLDNACYLSGSFDLECPE